MYSNPAARWRGGGLGGEDPAALRLSVAVVEVFSRAGLRRLARFRGERGAGVGWRGAALGAPPLPLDAYIYRRRRGWPAGSPALARLGLLVLAQLGLRTFLSPKFATVPRATVPHATYELQYNLAHAPPRTPEPSGTPSKLFRNPGTTFHICIPILRTIPELLVISRNPSGTPNNFGPSPNNFGYSTIHRIYPSDIER